MRINLIGAGRLGQTLGRLLSEHHTLGEVLTRTLGSAQTAVAFIGQGQAVSDLQDMQDADVWLLAVPDRHIVAVAQALSERPELRPSLVVHGSGAYTSELLAPLQSLGWLTASAHCLLSFAQPELAVTQFNGVVCALEGDAKALAILRPLMTDVGAQCFQIDAHHKLSYHAAAVWATNFLPVLQHTAEQLWQGVGMPEPMVQQLRTQLLSLAVNNVLTLGPQGALTGPASRDDSTLVQAQGRALTTSDPLVGAAYLALSELAAKMAGTSLR